MQRENPQAFRALNRYSGIFVCINYIDEKNAVKLPEFINASFISGIFYPFHIRKYIATQGPLANTIQDFWKMVWVYNVRSIFMLCSIKDCQNVMFI
jgi:protein tyrosine phosphatase